MRLRLPPTRSPAAGIGAAGPGPVVLVLPAYDEAATVSDVLRRVPPTVCGRTVGRLVVDDGSTDKTAELGAAAGAKVLRMRANRGLGAAVREGIRHALADGAAAIAFCDADGEYSPEELERLVAPILAGNADYVVGTRFGGRIHRMLPHRRFGNRSLTSVLRWVARVPITDGQSGYRALSADAARAGEIAHDFNYAQVLTLSLLRQGYRYAEVPISYRFREHGRSFVRLGRYLRAVVPAVLREVNRPVALNSIDRLAAAQASGGLAARRRRRRSLRRRPVLAGTCAATARLSPRPRGRRSALALSPTDLGRSPATG